MKNKYKIKVFFFSLLAALSMIPQAPAQGPSETIKLLKNSAWEGTFNSLLPGTIRIAFLSNLSAKGELQYFHKVDGSIVISDIVGPLDGACDFTPRAISLKSDSPDKPLNGTISVFSCAKTLEDELHLENDTNRKASFNVEVIEFNLTDKDTLHIVASIKGIRVEYNLKRQDLDPNTQHSLLELRSWVETKNLQRR